MKETLVQIYQHRMDRCQNEQVWALAVFAGLCALVVAEKETFLRSMSASSIQWGLGMIGLTALWFLFERLRGYYRYRNQIARYLQGESVADPWIKQESHPLSANGSMWVVVFLMGIVVPYLAVARILEAPRDPADPATSGTVGAGGPNPPPAPRGSP